jgi:hypothetical protein
MSKLPKGEGIKAATPGKSPLDSATFTVYSPPMELILTHRKRLSIKYGDEGCQAIVEAIERLQEALANKGTSSALITVDEPPPPSLPSYSPDPEGTPEGVKAIIDTLDAGFGEEGSDDRYWLIVGGDEIIPFYRLPNPMQDSDKVVFTDNPYASSDDEFLLPERSVGRLPGAQGPDPEPLISLLEWACRFHLEESKRRGSFGVTASIWKEASEVLFGELPDPRNLQVSPPVEYSTFDPNWLIHPRYLYFNVHGLSTSPNWYGQRAPSDPDHLPLFPIAITPDQIGDLRGCCIYTEACYGAYIFDKDPSTSIALRCLAQGATALVGSTTVAYGPMRPPSSEADLLGIEFLTRILQAKPVGMAFKEAKVAFARIMYERQGYLDEDDSKTLLQFLLYGDPSVVVDIEKREEQKVSLSKALIESVKREVIHQFPEMRNVEPLVVAKEVPATSSRVLEKLGITESKVAPGERLYVVTFEKKLVTQDGQQLMKTVRATVDQSGRVIKLMASK